MPKVAPYKRAAYEQAVAFRKRGFTYSEIAKICGVSRGTVSNWLAHEPFSKSVAKDNAKKAVADNTKRLSIINKARKSERAEQYKAVLHNAETEYKHYRNNPLFVAGLMLYVSEGDMSDDRLIRLADKRPELHAVFIRFMIEYMGVQKKDVHVWLLLYPDLDEVMCMKHWCRKIDISPAQFYRNQYVTGRGTKRTLHFGVGNTIIGNTLLKKKLTRWIELMSKDLKTA